MTDAVDLARDIHKRLLIANPLDADIKHNVRVIAEGIQKARETFQCGARRANTGANDPAECDWPVCGCDPYATKVIEALQESGVLK